jgi:hypothetical protein
MSIKINGNNRQDSIKHAVNYNLYSRRWAYKCPKHVELIYDNKLHLLHQVGSSRHVVICCVVVWQHAAIQAYVVSSAMYCIPPHQLK